MVTRLKRRFIMKKSTILLLCAATILFSACNQNAPVNKQREVKKLVLSPQDEAINVHQNEFTLNLLKQANANETESENVFLSPLSVSILCGMLTNGAGGNTLDQILSTIGAGDFSVDDLNNYYQNFISCVTSLDSTTDMNIADAIWVDDQCHVKEPFVEANKTFYFATVENLDLQSQIAPKTINDWADKSTKGLVRDIIKEPFSDACRMVLTNAIYFKGLWKDAFKTENTKTEPFNLADPHGFAPQKVVWSHMVHACYACTSKIKHTAWISSYRARESTVMSIWRCSTCKRCNYSRQRSASTM